MDQMDVEENLQIATEELVKILKEQHNQISYLTNCPEGRKLTLRSLRKLKVLRQRIGSIHNLLEALKELNYPSNDIFDLFYKSPSFDWFIKQFSYIFYAYISILVLTLLIDARKTDVAVSAAKFILETFSALKASNEFTQSLIAPKLFHYTSMVFEATSSLDSIVPILQICYDRALQYSNVESQATLLNLLLRSSILQKRFEQAGRMSVMQFPEGASNDECARYLYYIGRIRAIKLEYLEAFDCFQMALRRAPQNRAVGFHQTVTKFLVVVQLLLGEIPERKLFFQENLRTALSHYYKLAYAVKIGRMDRFDSVVNSYADRFRAEGTLSLISRLHHNVIKTGLRSICAAYSRISLADIAEKLALDDCSHYVEKAIYSGVVEAELVNNGEILQTTATKDVYTTLSPFREFDKRTTFCLDLHDQFRRAMRYMTNAN